MLPWLAHGHISPFFSLAKRLANHKHNFKIYFCSSPVNLNHIRQTLSIIPPSTIIPPSIHLVEIHLPSSPSLPPKFHTTKNLPPHLMPALKSAFDECRLEFCEILKTHKPDLLIYDVLQPWAPQAAMEVLGIKSVVFVPGSAACYSFLAHYSIKPAGQDWGITSVEGKQMVGFLKKGSDSDDDHNGNLSDEDRYMNCMKKSYEIILIKTSRKIEGKYVDYMSDLLGKEVVTVGGLVNEPDETDDRRILKWLNSGDHPDSSVVFVSFGSEYFLSKEEVEEIAKGLETMNKRLKFIWVVRFLPDQDEKVSLQEVLPERFLERVEGRGLVVEGWAPQGEILRSPRIGGFVSHCGWSSVIEAVVYGVPIVAMPMQLDQPWNANLVEEIGVGVEVRKKGGKRIDGEEMGKVIDEVVLNGGVRRRVTEISERFKGDADAEMDVAIEKLRNLIECAI
ncbi:Flavanone 7-O-glucoside 2''-O-beta-L-rhamnosyltransferase [Linum perenne]